MTMDSKSLLTFTHTHKKTEQIWQALLETQALKNWKICVQMIKIVSPPNVSYKDVSFHPSLFQVTI